MEVDDNVIMLDLTGDSKDCIMSDYGKLLVDMLNCTNMKILNGTHEFTMTNVLSISQLHEEEVYSTM